MEPRLFTSPQEIQRIKERLKRYDWYQESFRHTKACADEAIRRGLLVPQKKGFVFFDTCPRDNTRLVHDPYGEDAGVCPKCGMAYRDEPYRRARLLHIHHWLSQTAVQLGICYQISGDEAYAAAVRKVLADYAAVLPAYENNDNELGPTRVFQSTYMEGVWVSYLACAYDMTRMSGCYAKGERERIEEIVFREAARVIMDYDEGRNNRQAFNNSGIIAVGCLLEDKALIDYALNGPHGFVNHLRTSILEDGLWYEGDNYHFATLPSMVNIAECAMRSGIDLYGMEENGHSIRSMFDAPLKSLQPDTTFPSRKDSGYANDMRQRWYAGLYELGYARYGQEAYGRILREVYDTPRDDANMRNAAAGCMDVFKAASARRDRLDWRGFLTAEPDLGDKSGAPYTTCVNMPGTGLAVLRDERTYLALDYGDYGGGHGHPDRLSIAYFRDGRRLITDYGTGNYYFDHLRYYRSTLGHNTVGVDGRDHLPVNGVCTVFGEQDGMLCAGGSIQGIAPGVTFSRYVLHHRGALIDLCQLQGESEHAYRYALHGFGELSVGGAFEPCALSGDGYSFLHDVRRAQLPHGLHGELRMPEGVLRVLTPEESTTAYTAMAYGPPVRIPDLFPVVLLEQTAKDASFALALDPSDKPCVAAIARAQDGVDVTYADGSTLEVRVCHLGIKAVERTAEGEKIYLFDALPAKKVTSAFPVTARAFLPYDKGTALCIELTNRSDAPQSVSCSLFDAPVALEAGETQLRSAAIEDSWIHGERLCVSYALICGERSEQGTLDTAFLRVPRSAPHRPLFEGAPVNLHIDQASQIRRNERHWRGADDLSCEGQILNDGEQLLLRLHVLDDHVLFTGGKYPYDNDGVQLYIDRRPDSLRRTVNQVGREVYAFAVQPPVFDQCAKVRSLGKPLSDDIRVGVSVYAAEGGYCVELSFPWDTIGGAPRPGDMIGFDLLVNDRDSGTRRDIQAMWSGSRPNERVYLQEDHHAPARLGVLQFL